jgi:muconolactone delta-isomerase
MENSTFVISARIPTDTARRLKERLKNEEMSMSEFLQRYAIGAAKDGSADFRNLNIAQGIELANGGVIPTPKSAELPEEAKAMLSAIGGLASGAIVYQTLTTFLPDSMDKDEKETYAIVGALSTGIIAAVGIHNVLGKKQKRKKANAE